MLGLFWGAIPLLEVDMEPVVPSIAPPHLHPWAGGGRFGRVGPEPLSCLHCPRPWVDGLMGVVDEFFFPMPNPLGSFIAVSSSF